MVRWRPYSAIPSRFSNRYRAAEATLDKVSIGDDILENVLTFEYIGSMLQCDGDDQVDVRHRMDIAQAAFGSLSQLWTDHRLSRETKLQLYKLSVCSSLTYCSTAWALTRTMIRMINSGRARLIKYRLRRRWATVCATACCQCSPHLHSGDESSSVYQSW